MPPAPKRREPRPVSEVLGNLFARRGYARLLGAGELERAWNAAVGEPDCRQTRVGAVRRGVLNVTVAHPVLLFELANARKPEILAALRRDAAGTPIHDIRFRVGAIDPPASQPAPDPARKPGR